MYAHTKSPFRRFGIMLFGGLGLFALSLAAVMIGFHISYVGKIYPGVCVGWVDLSGQTLQQAADQLSRAYDYPTRGTIILRDGDQSWGHSPLELGLIFDPEYNAREAYNLGRGGSVFERLGDQFQAWYQGMTLPVQMSLDQRIAYHQLKTIAAQIDIPTIEASLSVDGVDVVVRAGQIGRRLNIPATLAAIETLTQAMLDGEITMVVDEDAPVIMDVEAQAEIARRILSAPLTVKMPADSEGEHGPWVFARQDVGGMLTIERVATPEGEEYQVGLSDERMRSFLAEIGPGLARKQENARFIFNDDTQELELIQPAVYGQLLDVEASIKVISEKTLAGEHTIALDMEYTIPEISDDATAESLSITELVSSHTTYFYGSSSSRRHNIHTAAARFHGIFVAPGETFSMAESLGNVSLDSGYTEAWIIYGDRTIKGVGGGVCQVSTTLFRAAFFGGFPIVERHPHAYRVYYYEQTYGGGNDPQWAGLDATVYVPVVDLKFTNDSDHWLLMETYAGNHYLTWKFYSASDGRTVEWETTGLTNIQEPAEPKYEENQELDKGEIKQVDWAIEGADVTVSRTVFRSGEILFADVFETHYQPWAAVCEYGPGTEGMPPEEPDVDNPCRAEEG
ncbi:MAG: VanW family protein, partial [Chloroflexota bacterium]|nr:VanW family protein [Chloroflexota bacterium]